MDHSIISLLEGTRPEDLSKIDHLDGVCCVYLIQNYINDKVYVGRTVNAKNRVKEHFFKDYHKYNGKKLSNAKDFHGTNNFLFYVLEVCERDDLVKLEQFYLDMIFPFDERGYNIRKTSSHDSSFIMEDDQKTKISSSLKLHYQSNPNPFKGKSHSEKSRELIKKRIRNEDGTLKNTWMGSEEQSEHMKEVARRNNTYSKLKEWYSKNEHPRKTPVVMLDKYTQDEILEFNSIEDALAYLGKKKGSSGIVNCLTGRSSSAYGHKWRYKNK